MKNLIITLLLASTTLLSAQNIHFKNDCTHDALGYNSGQSFTLPAAKYDFEEIIIPNNSPVIFPGAGNFRDTLDTFLQRASGYAIYQYMDTSGSPAPVTGYNSIYIALGSRYNFTGNAKIKGILIAYGLKEIVGMPDSLSIIVYNVDDFGNIKTPWIGLNRFCVADIDTNSLNPLFTYFDMGDTVHTDSHFAVYAQTRTLQGEEDFTAIFSNLDGDGNGEKSLCCLVADAAGRIFPEDLSDILTNGNNGPDFDAMIIPVLDHVAPVEKQFIIDGMEIRAPYPNPAVDFVDIEILSDKPARANISVINTSGRTQLRSDYTFSAGENRIRIDTAELASGCYFLIFDCEGTKFAKEIIICR